VPKVCACAFHILGLSPVAVVMPSAYWGSGIKMLTRFDAWASTSVNTAGASLITCVHPGALASYASN